MRGETSLRHKLSRAAGWVLVAAGLLAVVVITAITSAPDNALGAGLMFVGLLAGSFLAIAVHELGHALGAWLVGWRVWIISVVGIVVRPGYGPRLSTKLAHDVGGYVLGSPPDNAHDVSWRSIVFSAGGPLFSVLTGPLFIAWLVTLPRDGWETPIGAGLLGALLSFGAASTTAAMMTLWPFNGRRARRNDMGMILDAMFRRAEPTDTRGVAWAWALFDHGVEPSAWPLWMRESVERSAKTPWAPPVAPLLAFVMALDQNDEAAARAAAQRGSDTIGKLMHAFVAAYFDNDASTASSQLAAAQLDTREDTLLLFHALIELRIKVLNGESKDAVRSQYAIADDLRSGPPKPFWDAQLSRLA